MKHLSPQSQNIFLSRNLWYSFFRKLADMLVARVVKRTSMILKNAIRLFSLEEEWTKDWYSSFLTEQNKKSRSPFSGKRTNRNVVVRSSSKEDIEYEQILSFWHLYLLHWQLKPVFLQERMKWRIREIFINCYWTSKIQSKMNKYMYTLIEDFQQQLSLSLICELNLYLAMVYVPHC